jgi:hypothetical protein
MYTILGGVCLTKASRYELECKINEDRMQYAERCREENKKMTHATRYSICHHHLFHFVLTQPGRYYPRSTFVAIVCQRYFNKSISTILYSNCFIVIIIA